MKAKVKAVLFDLDNTLIDFSTMKKRSCKAGVAAMIKSGIPINKAKALKFIYQIYKRVGMDDRLVFQRFLRKYVGKIDERTLAAGIVAYRRERVKYYDPYPNVKPTLLRLKKMKLKLGIVTDAPRLKAWMRLYASNLDAFFDKVITFDDTKKRKPAKQPFIAAAKLLQVSPHECVMVGDWPLRDIIGAKNVGMYTVFAKYGNPHFEFDQADYTLKTFKEIPKLISILKSI